MKTVFTLLLSILCSISLVAQNSDKKLNNQIFLFPKFEDGIVTYKLGGSDKGKFNYNLITEKLMFSDKNQFYDLANPSDVSIVQIGDRTFKYMDKGYLYELQKAGDDILYIKWKSKATSSGKDVGYGGLSQTAPVSEMKTIINQGMTYDLSTSEDYTITPENKYYLMIKDKLKEIKSFSVLAKLFKKNESEIKEFIKKEQLDFKKIEDIKKAVAFCSQFK